MDLPGRKGDISTISNPYYSGPNYATAGQQLNHIRRKEIPKARHKPKGFFSRLRISKQDKIAANVQDHIRAVRAAEALDRQTARGRRGFPGTLHLFLLIFASQNTHFPLTIYSC